MSLLIVAIYSNLRKVTSSAAVNLLIIESDRLLFGHREVTANVLRATFSPLLRGHPAAFCAPPSARHDRKPSSDRTPPLSLHGSSGLLIQVVICEGEEKGAVGGQDPAVMEVAATWSDREAYEKTCDDGAGRLTMGD